MKNTILSLVLVMTAFVACQNEKEKTSTTTKDAAVTASTQLAKQATTAVAAPSMGEKASVQVLDKAGNVKNITLEQPKVVSSKAVESTKIAKESVKASTKATASPTPTPSAKVSTSKSTPSSKPVSTTTASTVTKKTDIPTTTPRVVTASTQTAVKEPTTETKTAPKKEVPTKPAFSHTPWDVLLRKHVSSTGKVNYDGFKADKAALDAYTTALAANPIQANWSRGKKMAYWINAYNAFTVKLIVDNYPLSSITDLEGGKPWDKKWIQLGTKTYSLNNIENDILRPEYKDARIHFAVNCAAQSCPPILNRAWTASNLEANFEKQAKAFINNPKYNQLDAKNANVSKIFEWYAADFGDLISFLNKYANTPIKSNAKIGYKDYDWGLNK